MTGVYSISNESLIAMSFFQVTWDLQWKQMVTFWTMTLLWWRLRQHKRLKVTVFCRHFYSTDRNVTSGEILISWNDFWESTTNCLFWRWHYFPSPHSAYNHKVVGCHVALFYWGAMYTFYYIWILNWEREKASLKLFYLVSSSNIVIYFLH